MSSFISEEYRELTHIPKPSSNDEEEKKEIAKAA